MPGLSGLELQCRLNATGHYLPIIFITAFADDGARTQALKAGAYGYLAKPFEEDDLLDCINRALQQQDTTPPGGQPP
jgi:FixJ family two-component response regulator